MLKVLVTGANGQLGSWMRNLASQNGNFIFSDLSGEQDCSAGVKKVCRYESLNITDADAVFSLVRKEGINVIVNCAAYTNVDVAEDNYALAEELNAGAVANLASIMKEVGGLLVHISTDYVFGGNNCNTPCSEDAFENPTGVYGLTKLHGEHAVKSIGCNHVIIRTSWLYSEYGKNFVKTMISLTSDEAIAARVSSGKPAGLKVVFDQVGTPTYARDLAYAVLHILADYEDSANYKGKILPAEDNTVASYSKNGTYHYSNEGVTSWFDFTRAIAEMAGHTNCSIVPCHSNEFPSKVTRPSYSVLDKTKIKSVFGIEIPYWIDSLKVCISNLRK